MTNSLIKRLSVFSLSLVLAVGLLVGCSSGDTGSEASTSEQQVAQQSEEDHEHDHEEGHEESAHEDEKHEHDHERMDHFEGKKAENYDEAVSNMTEATSRFEELLAKEELTGPDFMQIHRMSYTMENALKVLREESDGDYKDVAQSLESVHLASEKDDVETVRREGQNFLEGVQPLLDQE